jgi:hypothetical protein
MRFCARRIANQRSAGITCKDRTRIPGTGIFALVEHRDQRIVAETARYRISGLLRLPRDGYRSRLTDYLNASERSFLPLTEVEIAPLDSPEHTERRAFLALSLRHIVLAMPADEAAIEREAEVNQP